MGWGSVVAGVLLLVKFNVPVLWLTLALSAIGGATAVASSVGVETLAQERTPSTSGAASSARSRPSSGWPACWARWSVARSAS
jgi:hypothetical protein